MQKILLLDLELLKTSGMSLNGHSTSIVLREDCASQLYHLVRSLLLQP